MIVNKRLLFGGCPRHTTTITDGSLLLYGDTMDKTLEIMTPDHEKWEDFVAVLEGEDGCSFFEDEKGKTTWKCKGGNDQTFARKILSLYDDIDVEGSLKYFTEHGGHCDCEILWNVHN